MKMKFVILLTLIFYCCVSFGQQIDSAKIKDIKKLLILSGSAKNAKVGVMNMANIGCINFA